jgi:hypothetical protein
MHPNTFTCVPAGTHATNGKLGSGPARRLTDCVVNAGCAQAAAGNSIAAATSVRQSERARFEESCMESIRHKGLAVSNADDMCSVYVAFDGLI